MNMSGFETRFTGPIKSAWTEFAIDHNLNVGISPAPHKRSTTNHLGRTHFSNRRDIFFNKNPWEDYIKEVDFGVPIEDYKKMFRSRPKWAQTFYERNAKGTSKILSKEERAKNHLWRVEVENFGTETNFIIAFRFIDSLGRPRKILTAYPSADKEFYEVRYEDWVRRGIWRVKRKRLLRQPELAEMINKYS